MKVAAITTTFYPKSHADAIVTKFMVGASIDEGYFEPEVDLVSLYIDHVLENDIGLEMAKKHGVKVYPSIRRALHAGGSDLGVDAVLLIGEHGDYPWNERGRHMYPRRHFFEQIAGVFAESGRSVPVYNDKHFAYDFQDAMWMWKRAKELGIPLMAGSSLPLAWRNPWVEYRKGVSIDEALSIGYSNAIEAYGYHAIELLLCMVERRKGGESGISSVRCIQGDDVWVACEKGVWSSELAEAAIDVMVPERCGPLQNHVDNPVMFLINHRDNLRTSVLMLPASYVQTWGYAARVDGEVHGVEFYLQPDGPGAHFGYLSRNIQQFFKDGLSPYPPERTLLATGIVDALMTSRYEGYRLVETPQLDIEYDSYDDLPIHPKKSRPEGASVDTKAPDILIEWGI